MATKQKGREERRPSLHERITQKIVEELKQGVAPWVKPWGYNGLVGVPRNYVSNRPYSGINVLLVWLSALEHGFNDSRWLTANQIIALGGSFKGEKAIRILFAKSYVRAEGTDEEETRSAYQLYNIFNASQVSGIDLEPEAPPSPLGERLETAEAFIAAQDVTITHGGDQAFYLPSRDVIKLPFPGTFTSASAYYAVVLHEFAHFSGHPQRLNRVEGKRGSSAYAFEELVAELTAAFLCAELGVPECSHHAGYIGSWISLLEDDPKAIFNAAREASAAAEYLKAQAGSAQPLAEAA